MGFMYFPNRRAGELTPRSLYEQGEYSPCLIIIGESPTDPEEIILRIRCLIRTEAYHEAIRLQMRTESLTGHRAYEALTLLATACYRARSSRAGEFFTKAYELAAHLELTVEQMAELHYFDALRQWSAGEFDEADKLVAPLLSMERWRQHALNMLAWTAFGRGDMLAHREYLREALGAKHYDIQMYATVLQCYAEVARETYRSEDLRLIEAHAKAIHWPTGDLLKQKFYAYEELGWICELSGCKNKAVEYFVKAEQVAEGNAALMATILFDKAYISIADDETNTATENLVRALDVIERATFTNGTTDRIALLNMTVGCARMGNVMAAQSCWNRYQSILTPITPIKAFGLGDKRLYALECNAHAWLMRAMGDTQRALTSYKEAFETWKSIGYAWRSALVAASIADIGGPRSYADFAIRETDKHFPQAWFASALDKYRRRKEDPSLTKLSNTKRSIIKGLLRGDTYAKIAKQLSIAEQTVTNHVQELYNKFTPDKRTRVALMAHLRKLGAD